MKRVTADRVLVTGGAGFLGSHLCDRLVSQGKDVVCVDNYFTGTKRNVDHLVGRPNFELMRHDVTFPLYIEVDQIFNLACPASPIHYQHDPVQTTKTSVHGAIKVARIFNTYGPRMHPNDGRVVSTFIVQALRGESISIFGDGSQTRSFCYVSDLIEAFVRYMDLDEDFPGPLNLGNPTEFTILELAEEVIRQIGSRSKITRNPLPPDDPKQRRPDISLASARLGWQPTVPLVEGLKRTIEYFDALLTKGVTVTV
jgi:nucleoside-diphosphate-sugar epimerase